MSTTGGALFVLDVLFVLGAWPLVLWLSEHAALSLREAPYDLRAILYPLTNWLALYSMGLYRRDALTDIGRALSRVPLVVGIECSATLLLSMTPAVFGDDLPTLGGRD